MRCRERISSKARIVTRVRLEPVRLIFLNDKHTFATHAILCYTGFACGNTQRMTEEQSGKNTESDRDEDKLD